MTFKILISYNNKIIFLSSVRPVTAEDRNFRSEQGRKSTKNRKMFAPDSEDGEGFDPSHDSFQNYFANENYLDYSSSTPTTSLNEENGENNPHTSTLEPFLDDNPHT